MSSENKPGIENKLKPVFDFVNRVEKAALESANKDGSLLPSKKTRLEELRQQYGLSI